MVEENNEVWINGVGEEDNQMYKDFLAYCEEWRGKPGWRRMKKGRSQPGGNKILDENNEVWVKGVWEDDSHMYKDFPAYCEEWRVERKANIEEDEERKNLARRKEDACNQHACQEVSPEERRCQRRTKRYG